MYSLVLIVAGHPLVHNAHFDFLLHNDVVRVEPLMDHLFGVQVAHCLGAQSKSNQTPLRRKRQRVHRVSAVDKGAQ